MKPGQSDSDSGAELAHHMYKAEPGMGGLAGMTDGHHHAEHAGTVYLTHLKKQKTKMFLAAVNHRNRFNLGEPGPLVF